MSAFSASATPRAHAGALCAGMAALAALQLALGAGLLAWLARRSER